MHDWNALADEDFAEQVRSFVAGNCPPELRFPKQRLRWVQVRDWYLTLSRAGMLAPAWPAQYGGMGLDPGKYLIYVEEMELAGAPRLPDQGIINLAPLLIKFGSDWQRSTYLPKILSGEHVWCQGYSEPNAGSDLASLRTKADLVDDRYIINGQKTWTTWAIDATHMFALVRTDSSVAKQAGISFILIDLKQPGVTVRPIQTLLGHAEFCEVFLDNVISHRDNLVGQPNAGWKMAKALLGFERIWAGSPRQAAALLAQLEQLAIAAGRMSDPSVRDRLAQNYLDVRDLASIFGRFAAIVRRGEPLGADVSILKIWATETCQRITETMIEIAGDGGAFVGDAPFANGKIDLMTPFLDSRSFTIYGGTSEIQRNILAKNILGLPQ